MDHLSAGKDLARVLHKSAASALKRAPSTHRMWLCVRVCVCVHDCDCVILFVLIIFFLFHVIYFFSTGVTQDRE